MGHRDGEGSKEDEYKDCCGNEDAGICGRSGAAMIFFGDGRVLFGVGMVLFGVDGVLFEFVGVLLGAAGLLAARHLFGTVKVMFGVGGVWLAGRVLFGNVGIMLDGRVLFGNVGVLFVFEAGVFRGSFCLGEIPPILIAGGQGDGIQGSCLRNAGKLSVEEALDG